MLVARKLEKREDRRQRDTSVQQDGFGLNLCLFNLLYVICLYELKLSFTACGDTPQTQLLMFICPGSYCCSLYFS